VRWSNLSIEAETQRRLPELVEALVEARARGAGHEHGPYQWVF
jgi:hypothetical protein